MSWENQQITHTFNSRIDNLQPGETRLVAQSTQADYIVYSGRNHLSLPPLYVDAAHIIAIDPPLQVLGPGGSTEFSVVLTNTTALPVEYALSSGGLSTGWASLPDQVTVPAHSSTSVPLSVSVPLGAGEASYPFNVAASSPQGIHDQAGATLTVTSPLLAMQISPPERSARLAQW